MIILGIDPGLAIVGYGVIKSENGKNTVLDYGVIKTPANLTNPQRLELIEQALIEIIKKYKPDETAIEELFFHTNVKTAISVAEARGVIVLTCKKNTKALYEYTPLQIKQAITGYGKAEKGQIQFMVKALLSLKAIPKPDDAADALAIALTHIQSSKFKQEFKIK